MLIFSMAVVSPFVISFFLKDLYHCWSLQPPLFFISLYTLYTALPLAELAGKIDYRSVGAAVQRFEQRCHRDPGLARLLARAEKVLKNEARCFYPTLLPIALRR